MIVPLYLHLGKQSMRVGWLRAAGPKTPFEIPLNFKIDKATICDWEDVLHR